MEQPRTPDRLSIGRSIKAAREHSGMTQEDVSHALRDLGHPRDSLGTVQRWESSGSIKVDDAMVLAALYGMTVDELVMRDPASPEPTSGAREPAGPEAVREGLPAVPVSRRESRRAVRRTTPARRKKPLPPS